jgi:hypothetical protein
MAMYKIDFTTCTAIDVIQRSITCHPMLLRDALLSSLAEDNKFAVARPHSREVRDAIESHANAIRRAISLVAAEDAQAFVDDLGAGIVAFEIAARFNLVPRHCRTAMVERTWPATTV